MRIAATGWAVAAGLFLSAPAHAQDDDWDRTDLEGGGQLASVIFDTGFGVAVRCRASTLEVLVAGLPDDPAPTRQMRYSIGDFEEAVETWPVGTVRSTAIAPRPAHIARRLRSGGRLSVGVEVAGAPPRRYVADIPPSPNLVNETLIACGEAVEDERDSVPAFAPSALSWAERPLPEFPQSALSAGALWGRVQLGCLVSDDGPPQSCRVESEYPPGLGFGRAALASVRSARLAFPDGAPNIDHAISFPISFRAE